VGILLLLLGWSEEDWLSGSNRSGFVNLSGISNHMTRRYASRSVSGCLRGSIATPVVILSTHGYVSQKSMLRINAYRFYPFESRILLIISHGIETTNNFYDIMGYSRPGVTYSYMWSISSGGSWWNWPGGPRNFISGWTHGIVSLAVFIISGFSSHSSSPNLIKFVIFSCPCWYIENIHLSLMKPNPNPKA